jgi:hypothetical protein
MKKEKDKKEFYLNPAAIKFQRSNARRKVLVAGRGFSKSFGNGITVSKKIRQLPRSSGLFMGPTFTQMLTKTLLPMKSAWEAIGYREGIHYVIGKQPPKYFERPLWNPNQYDNTISFWTGNIITMGSFDRPQLMRGGSYDWSVLDEALLIDYDEYEEVVIPAVRPSHPVFKGMPGSNTQQFTSSMPYRTSGRWLLDMQEKAKDKKNDIFFMKGISWDNRKVIGDDKLWEWYRDMTRYKYLIEIMCQEIKTGTLFYPSLRKRHIYRDELNYHYIDKLGINLPESSRDSRWDADCNPDLPISISHDWGAFNCITIDQEYKISNELRFINYMYVKHPDIITDLANNFCEYYKHHRKKVIYQYGDKSGNKDEANSKQSYFEDFANVLRSKGWKVFKQRTGDVGHLLRHKFINDLHRGTDPRQPSILYNGTQCRDLIIALENTDMKPDGKKNKRSENNPNIEQEQATHVTDAHDYRLMFGLYYKSNEDIPYLETAIR